MKKISQEYFQKLSEEWTSLDNKYDELFKGFLNNPKVKDPKEVGKFRSMQQRLYAIEDELYKVAMGEIVIEK